MGAEIYDARIRPSGINKTGIYVCKDNHGIELKSKWWQQPNQKSPIKLVYICAKATMELNWNYNDDHNQTETFNWNWYICVQRQPWNWIEINMMTTTKSKHSIETGIYICAKTTMKPWNGIEINTITTTKTKKT